MRDLFQRAMEDIFSSTTTKNNTECNAQTFDIDEVEPELVFAQTRDESETRQKNRKTVDPLKRADTRFTGC